jgi:hypothetical protein
MGEEIWAGWDSVLRILAEPASPHRSPTRSLIVKAGRERSDGAEGTFCEYTGFSTGTRREGHRRNYKVPKTACKFWQLWHRKRA